MALTAELEASFTADGFDLASAFADLGALFGDVDLPGLDIDISVSVGVDGLGTGGISGSLGGVIGGLDSIVAGLPDLDAVLGPLQLAVRLPELLAELDLDALIAELSAAVVASGPGLAPLVEATASIGSLPLVGSLADLLGALGLDLRSPGTLIGGTAGGIVALLQLVGALLAVEAASRAIEARATLAADLLGAERLTGLVARVRSAGGPHLATLLVGIDPDDPGLVDLVGSPIQTYAGLVAELTGALVRGLAFAEATVVDADFGALVTGLGAASVALSASAVGPVRDLVASAAPLVDQITTVTVPSGGEDVVFGAVAELRGRIETAIDELAPSSLSTLVDGAIDPLLAPVRTVRAALDEVAAVVGVVFAPIEQALGAVDLASVGSAIEAVVDPVADTVDAITAAIGAAQGAIEDAVAALHTALTPVRTAVTGTATTLTEPFAAVHEVVAALDLEALQSSIRATLDAVTAAIAAAPVQPVFDVATGIIETAADALGLVPKALLPDDLRNELEAACAPVEALDLQPVRVELHDQLAAMIASIDAGALEAVAAGYAAVQEFVASIDPHPHVDALETAAFQELVDALNAIDPTVILTPVLEALDTARAALADLDLDAVLAPIDDALDEVAATIEGIDPAVLLEPVTSALDDATTAVRSALHLDELDAMLADVDTSVADAIGRLPVEDMLIAVEGAWDDLLVGLRGSDAPSGGVARGLLAGLLPGVPVEGLPEVLAWIRGERDGSVVVRARLERASARLTAASLTIGALDIRGLTVELGGTHGALSSALSVHPTESLLVQRLSAPIAASDPSADLGLVLLNADRVKVGFAGAAATVSMTTAADRSEVQLTARELGAAFTPLAPVLETARRLAAFIGVDAAELAGPGGPRLALVSLAQRIGPDPILGTVRAVVTHLVDRLTDLIHDGLVAPLQGAVGELGGLLDALSVDALLADVTAVRDRLTALVDGLRPGVVLAAPLAAFDGLVTTLDTFDPMGLVRTVVDGLRTEITSFATDLAPTTLLAPVLTLYDDLAAAIGAFDVAGLLEPVLNALDEIGRIIDRGIDEVIDALGSLQAACESEGGPIPGLDLSIAASVDVGGFL